MLTNSRPIDRSERGRNFYVFIAAFVAAVGGFLFGYDLAVVGAANLYLRDYFGMSQSQLGFATGSATMGCMAGPFLGAWLCDAIGRKRTMIAASLLLALSAVMTGLATEIDIPRGYHFSALFVFNAFRIVGGVGVGLCSVASPMYISELALGPLPWLMMSELYPTRIRARALSLTTTFLWATIFSGAYLFPILKGASENMIGSAGGVFWLFTIICGFALLFGWRILPETKGRTLEEIAESWRTPPRSGD